MKIVTILFLKQNDKILLAMKKRGFGAGKWNGVGGKVEGGEDIAAAAIRECQEEIGVAPSNPRLVGRLKFYEKTDPNFCHYAHVFVSNEWTREPRESQEMRPRWFEIDKIPYWQMWATDQAWLPYVVEGKLFEGSVTSDNWQPAKDSIRIKLVKTLESDL